MVTKCAMIEPRMLAYLEPNDKEAFEDWARQHAEWHTRIYLEAVKKGFTKFDVYPMRDIGDLEGWTYFHNLEHENITHSIFIGDPVDLSGLDPDDKDVWASWMQAHAQIHAEIRTALGIIG